MRSIIMVVNDLDDRLIGFGERVYGRRFRFFRFSFDWRGYGSVSVGAFSVST